jgi:hypothetical protein
MSAAKAGRKWPNRSSSALELRRRGLVRFADYVDEVEEAGNLVEGEARAHGRHQGAFAGSRFKAYLLFFFCGMPDDPRVASHHEGHVPPGNQPTPELPPLLMGISQGVREQIWARTKPSSPFRTLLHQFFWAIGW